LKSRGPLGRVDEDAVYLISMQDLSARLRHPLGKRGATTRPRGCVWST